MTKEDLIPIRTTERAQELGRRGGLVTSEAKTEANILNASKLAKCKNCKLDCPIKQNILEYDLEAICEIPEARKDAIYFNMEVMTSDLMAGHAMKIILVLQKCAEKSGKVADFKRLHDAIMALWGKLYPSSKTKTYEEPKQDLAALMVAEIFKKEQEETKNKDNALAIYEKR